MTAVTSTNKEFFDILKSRNLLSKDLSYEEVLNLIDKVDTAKTFSTMGRRELFKFLDDVDGGIVSTVTVPMNMIVWEEIWPYIKSGSVILKSSLKFRSTITNDKSKYTPKAFLPSMSYNPETHHCFDNHPTVININKVSEIPSDYFDLMGVPITFMINFNFDEFECIGIIRDGVCCGKKVYPRAIIKRKRESF